MLCKFRIGAQWLFYDEQVRRIVRIDAVSQRLFLALPDGSERSYTRRELATIHWAKYIAAEQLSFPSIAPIPEVLP